MREFVTPGEVLRLWILYQENGAVVSGLTDLKVLAKDSGGNTVLALTDLTEEGSSGEYYYNWDTTGIPQSTDVRVYFRKGSDVLCDEWYYFENIEDADGRAF